MAPIPSTPANKTSDAVKNLIDAGYLTFSFAPFADKLGVPTADIAKYTQDTTLAQLVEAATRPPR